MRTVLPKVGGKGGRLPCPVTGRSGASGIRKARPWQHLAGRVIRVKAGVGHPFLGANDVHVELLLPCALTAVPRSTCTPWLTHAWYSLHA
jgi:hypothetical protein